MAPTTAAPEVDVAELKRLADQAVGRQDLEVALLHLSEARSVAPADGDLALLLGHVQMRLGNTQEAAAQYATAVAQAVSPAEAMANLALTQQLLGQISVAAENAQNALAHDPDQIVALKVLGRIHLDSNRHDDARALCRRILSLRPHDREAVEMLGQCRFNLAEFEDDLPELPQISSESLRLETAAKNDTLPSTSLQDTGLTDSMGDFARRHLTWSSVGSEHWMQQFVEGTSPDPILLKHNGQGTSEKGADGWALPPAALDLGYGAGNMDEYLESGRRSHSLLTSILTEQNIHLAEGSRLLDWGCAAGRVVRTFARESSRGCQVWGCDVNTSAIEWAQNHLSPPFRFFNSTSFPRFPLPDSMFNFVYGLSTFNHLVVLRDMWLLELNRVLKPGGFAVVTVQDENSWGHFRNNGMPDWVPVELRHHTDLPAECMEIRGSSREQCHTFFHSGYIRRVWGQFLDVIDIKPKADGYQAAVVMRKPWSSVLSAS